MTACRHYYSCLTQCLTEATDHAHILRLRHTVHECKSLNTGDNALMNTFSRLPVSTAHTPLRMSAVFLDHCTMVPALLSVPAIAKIQIQNPTELTNRDLAAVLSRSSFSRNLPKR